MFIIVALSLGFNLKEYRMNYDYKLDDKLCAFCICIMKEM